MPPVIPMRQPRLLLAYLSAGLLVVAVQAGTLTFIGPHLLDGQLVDPDSYTWVNHVERLLETGAWYDHTQPRANWPRGEVQHSTRPLDAILLVATVALAPLLGREAALFWAGAAVSPLLYLGLAAAVAWTAAGLFGRWRGPVAVAVLSAQFAVLVYSLPGRADHHTLIMLVFTLAMGLTARALRDPDGNAKAALAGASAGFGVWLSPEFLLVLAACFGALTWGWIRSGARTRSANGSLFSSALGGAIAAALLLEYPLAEILMARFDRISIADLVIALLAIAFWWVVRAEEARRTLPLGIRGRWIIAALGAAFALGGFALAFPGFFAGPLAGIDPRARIILVNVVSETGGLLPADAPGVLSLLLYLGFPLLALPVAVAGMRREWSGPLATVWTLFTLVLVIYLGAALFMLRFAPYAAIAGAIVISDLLVRLATGKRVATRIAAGLAGVAVVTAAAAAAHIAGRSLERLPPCHHPLRELAAFIDGEADDAGHPWTIATFADLGPELLHRTKHRVIATPSFSNQDGAIAMFTIFSATDDRTARSVIAERGVDHVLVCRALGSASLSAGDPRLIARLFRSDPPPWLEQMPLPTAIETPYDLYRVRPEGME